MAQHELTMSSEELLNRLSNVEGFVEGLRKAADPELYDQWCAADKEFDDAHWRGEPHSERRAHDKLDSLRSELEDKVKHTHWRVTFAPKAPDDGPSE